MRKFFILAVVLLVAVTTMSAQITPGKLAVNGVIQGLVGNGLGIGYGLSENMKLGATVGFRTVSDNGGSNFGLGANLQYYMKTAENVSTFVGGEFAFESMTPPGPGASSATGIALGGFLGAEYWFSPNFSWSGHLGLRFSSAGSPSVSTIETFMGGGLTWWFSL